MTVALDQLPPLRDVIRDHGLRAEKSLGQNFILDLNITDKIVRACGDLDGVHVFEIGPGPGGLTRSLLASRADSVTAIEFDERAIAALQAVERASAGRLTLIKADALHTDLLSLSPAPRAIVANLPYNISTILLVKWLKEIDADAGHYRSLTLMFQREVAERLTAAPHTKEYGRLSVITQYLCDVSKAFDLPPEAFTPPPKVTSSVMFLRPKPVRVLSPDFMILEKILAAGFQQRRKMIRQSLKTYMPLIEKLGINPTLRAENLRVEDYLRLATEAAA